MVLTLKGPSKALAYALTHDFNFRDPESHTRFHVGQGVSGTVVALPSGKTGDCTPQDQLSPGLRSCSGIVSTTPMLTHHLRIQQQAQGHWHKQRSYVSCMPPCHAVLSPFSASHACQSQPPHACRSQPCYWQAAVLPQWPGPLHRPLQCLPVHQQPQSAAGRKGWIDVLAVIMFASVWHAALILRKPPTGCCYIWMVKGGSLLGHSAYHNRSRLVHAQTVIASCAGARLLVQVTLMPKVKGASSRPAGDHKAGTRVTGRITVMEPTYMDLELDAPRGDGSSDRECI